MLYHSEIRLVDTDRLLQLERKCYEQRERYRDDKSKLGGQHYEQNDCMLQVVRDELSRRKA